MARSSSCRRYCDYANSRRSKLFRSRRCFCCRISANCKISAKKYVTVTLVVVSRWRNLLQHHKRLFMKNYIHYILLVLCLFTASTLQANEATPLFHVTKKGSGPVMVLIPGLMSDARVWSPIEAELAEHFELHLIELKGFGRTPASNGNEAPEPGWLRAVQQQLLAYIEAEGLTQPVIVGHSLGGFLALALAVEAPAQIGRVVSIDGLPYLAPVYTRDPTTTPEQMAAPAQNMLAFYRSLPNAEALEHTMLQNIGIHAESRQHQQWIMKMSAESAPDVA